MQKWLGMAGVAAIGIASPAFGQDSPPARDPIKAQDAGQAPAAPQSDGIADIIVTARKTEEKLQRVPITVTALSSEGIRQQTIQTTNDVQFHVAGLVQSPEPQGGQPDFAIRGTRQQGAIGSQGGVAVYMDYTPLLSTNAIAYSTYDMQSIQVLKGPQGTLFGKNTTGGAIIFAPNKPTQQFEGFVTGSYGNYNRTELTGMLNVPLTETLVARVSGSFVRRDGYTENVATSGNGPSSLDNERHESGRAILRWSPTDRFTNDLVAEYTHIHNNPIKGITVAVAAPCTLLYANCASALAEQQSLGARKVDFVHAQFERSQNWGIADTATYDLGALTIRNIFSYQRNKNDDLEDNDGLSTVPVLSGENHTRGRSVTNELDFIGKLFDDKLDYTLGFYYSDSRFDQHFNVGVFDLQFNAAGAVTGGLPSYFGASPSIANNTFYTQQKAVFGQLNYHVTDRFTITAGTRYTHEHQRAITQQFMGTISPTNNALRCQTSEFFADNPGLDSAACVVRREQDFDPITWNVSLNYQLQPTTLLYASVGRGFQAGGFNTQIPMAQYQSYAAETVTSYETGLKSDWHLAGRPIRTNLSVFLSKYDNQQRVINDTLPGGRTFIATFNAAKSTIYGAELEVNYLPTPALELSGFYSYIHAKYDNFLSPPIGVNGGQNLSDSAISSTPKQTLSGTIAYSLGVGAEGKIRGSLTGYYRSSTYTNDLVQTAYTRLPGYTLLNARIDVLKLAPVDIGLWMNNVTNKLYKVFGFDTLTNALGYATAQYGAPRTFGADVTFKF